LKLDEARAQFEKAAKLDPKRPEPVMELVLDAVERGKLSDALTRAETAEAAIDPGALHRLRTARAVAYTRKRQFEQAEKELQKAIDENPRDADARAAYATTLVVMRRYDEAEKQVTEAAVWDQKNPAVLVAQGDIALGRGEPRAALEHYEEAMKVVPNAHQPYLRAAVAAVALKDIARAKGFADTAGQLRPGIAEVLSAQAAVQEPADPKAAARLYEQARDLSPEDPYFPYALGVIFQKIGAFLEAIDSFKQATALDPDYGDAYFALGRVYRELGRNTEAKNAYTDVTRIDPRRADAWIEIADLLATIGDVPEALKAYDKAIEVEPKNSGAVCSMGETLVVRLGDEMKNLRRGTEVLERCVKMKPKHQTAWKNLGNAYKTFNKKKDAIRAYKEHLKVAPDDVENSFVQDFITDLGGKL
jgi:tetratricopeptide (TPR) repeat protein